MLAFELMEVESLEMGTQDQGLAVGLISARGSEARPACRAVRHRR